MDFNGEKTMEIDKTQPLTIAVDMGAEDRAAVVISQTIGGVINIIDMLELQEGSTIVISEPDGDTIIGV